MKALPWVLVAVLLAAAGFLFVNGKKIEADLVALRQQHAELSDAHDAALEQARQAESQIEGSNLAQKEREELVRLRNEVGQLRRDKQQLSAQVKQAEQKNDQLLQSQQTQQQQQAQQLEQLQKQNVQLVQQTQEQQDEQARNQCINNLRQLDGAIQQWALENQQPANATVTMNAVLPYLKNSAAPVCPSGGTYSLTTVSATPTCNIPGHALPQ